MAGIFKINNNEIIDSAGKLTTTAFPSGSVLQVITATHAPSAPTTVTHNTDDDYLGSDLQCPITPKANGNKLYVTAFIPDVYNSAIAGRALNAGFVYDADFSSGNGTTLGLRKYIAAFESYISSNVTFLSNLQYSTSVTVGTNAPSAGSPSIIRPLFAGSGGDIQIATNENSDREVYSLMVMEIQQ